MKWQVATCYGNRSLVKTAICRYKPIIRHRLRARSFDAQQSEVAIGCAVLNRMLACTHEIRPLPNGKGIASVSKTENRSTRDPCINPEPIRFQFNLCR